MNIEWQIDLEIQDLVWYSVSYAVGDLVCVSIRDSLRDSINESLYDIVWEAVHTISTAEDNLLYSELKEYEY